MAGAPGAVAGAPGAAGAAKPAETPFVLRIDPAKLPSDTALKALMFPGTTAAAVDDQGFRFVSRVAFPTLIAPDSLANQVVTAMLKPAIQNAAAAAAAKRGGQPGALPSTTTAPSGGATAAPRPGAR
jgi:hypothetical protein